MALTQETFLGASIAGFDGSLGWGSQASTLTVNLVEDDKNGDSFNPPGVGTAVLFDYQGWQFGGILQSYQRQYGQQGNPVYSVQLQDPRELLSGVQLILADYNGSTYGVDNLYNIYGYLESLYGFGGSQVNETGIPWMLVRDAFYILQLTQPIYFRGTYYLLDPFYGYDLLPSYYRIRGDFVNALDYINDICNALACDFFVDMIPLDNDETPASNLIRPRLVRRDYALRNDAINTFVTQTEGAVSKQSGYELSNQVTTKFVVGGKQNNLYFQGQETYNTATMYDDTIVPYWGYNAFGNLAIGTGDFNGPTGHEYQVTIDGRPMYLQTGNMSLVNYTTDLAELHAARAGQKSWEAFLWFYNDEPTSIHFGKAQAMGLTSGRLSSELMKWLRDWRDGERPDAPTIPGARAIASELADIERASYLNEEKRKQIAKIYDYINRYATEYYGKKFMVRVPFVAGAWEPETNLLKFSLTPTQTGYLPESYWGNAQFYGLMPYNPEKFTAEDNRIYPYARFSAMGSTTYEDDDGEVYTSVKSQYGLDRLSLESFILDQYPNLKLGAMRENLFVKCTVDEKLVFLNPTTLFSPRAVITLDGPVPNATKNKELYTTALIEEIKTWVKNGNVRTDEEIEAWAKKFGAMFGSDALWKAKDANFNIPVTVALPLESQVLRYGPWYIQNTSGKVEFENDSSLTPWNYGGFLAMYNAGWAKVEDALTVQQVHETGSVEYPGVPTLTLGSALINAGPTVTDINVNISANGVTTTYRMATWSARFGRLGKYNVERFSRLSKIAMEQRKAFRKFYGYAEPINYFASDGAGGGGPSVDDGPPALMVSTMVRYGEGDEEKVTSSTTASTIEDAKKHMVEDIYIDSAAVSMDALYVPFTSKTDGVSTNLPKFETPADDATSPTVVDLNPFGGDSISVVTPATSGSLPDSLKDKNTEVNSIALRSPLIVAGWGYNTNGDPVPSGADGEFETGYKKRADKWKVGPVDLRWDNDRKVWAAGGSEASLSKIGKTTSVLTPSGTTDVAIWTYTNDEYSVTSDTQEDVRDWLMPGNVFLPVGTKVVITKIGDEWYVTAAGPPC